MNSTDRPENEAVPATHRAVSNAQLNRGVVINSSTHLVNNIVSGEKLREIQSRVLRDLKDAIIHSMGLM